MGEMRQYHIPSKQLRLPTTSFARTGFRNHQKPDV